MAKGSAKKTNTPMIVIPNRDMEFKLEIYSVAAEQNTTPNNLMKRWLREIVDSFPAHMKLPRKEY